MIIDTSAIMAIIRQESLATALLRRLDRDDNRRISAGNWVELQAVSTRRFGGEIDVDIARLRDELAIKIVPITLQQADIARDAYRRYGIGSGSPARLNFGDCFAYALAKATAEPLLYVGDDFVHTDILSAL